jgi:hypothetical protein
VFWGCFSFPCWRPWKSGRVVWKTNSDWGSVMGVVHVLCKVVNEVMCCCCADLCEHAPHVKLSTQRNTVESLIPHCPISPRLTSLTPCLLPSLISVTSLTHLRLTRPHLPHSLPLLPPNTPAQSEPNFEVVGWFENLTASIRIKIRIYENSPVPQEIWTRSALAFHYSGASPLRLTRCYRATALMLSF